MKKLKQRFFKSVIITFLFLGALYLITHIMGPFELMGVFIGDEFNYPHYQQNEIFTIDNFEIEIKQVLQMPRGTVSVFYPEQYKDQSQYDNIENYNMFFDIEATIKNKNAEKKAIKDNFLFLMYQDNNPKLLQLFNIRYLDINTVAIVNLDDVNENRSSSYGYTTLEPNEEKTVHLIGFMSNSSNHQVIFEVMSKSTNQSKTYYLTADEKVLHIPVNDQIIITPFINYSSSDGNGLILEIENKTDEPFNILENLTIVSQNDEKYNYDILDSIMDRKGKPIEFIQPNQKEEIIVYSQEALLSEGIFYIIYDNHLYIYKNL